MKIKVNKDKVKIKNADFGNSHLDKPSQHSHWLSDIEDSYWLSDIEDSHWLSDVKHSHLLQQLLNQKLHVNLPKSIKIHIFVLVQLLENHSHITWLNIM